MSEKQLRKRFQSLLRVLHREMPGLVVHLTIGSPREFPAVRDYAYCGYDDGTEEAEIVVAPKILSAGKHRQEGLLRHELAHAYLMAQDLRHSERDCDRVAEELFGDPIYYDRQDVQTTSKREAARRRRPSHLPTGLE